MAAEVVLSQPLDELAVANAKFIKECTEIYLANKNITELDGFEPFTNLETLWINNNKLEYIDDLDDCVRLQHLYAQNNQLDSLDGSLSSLKNLRTLMLNNNNLSNLETCLNVLSIFPNLETLDLSNNPVAEEDRYRIRVIQRIPTLKVLDGLKIKPSEVKKNKKGKRTRGKSKGFSWKDNLSATVKIAEQEHARLERQKKEQSQREKLALFQNLEVLRSKSLKTAPISKYSQPPSYKTQRDGGERLSGWDLHRGRQLFDQCDINKNGYLSKDELNVVVQDMEEEGLMLRDGEESALQALLEALDANSDGKISWAEFEHGLSGELVDDAGKAIQALRWRCLSSSEAKHRSEELYVLATKLQMKLGMLEESPETKIQREELKAEILRLSQIANRFSVLAKSHNQSERMNTTSNPNSQVGSRKSKSRNNAKRTDDIRFFEWDIEEPDSNCKGDWSSDEDDEEGRVLKKKIGISAAVLSDLKQTKLSRKKGASVRNFKGYTQEKIFE